MTKHSLRLCAATDGAGLTRRCIAGARACRIAGAGLAFVSVVFLGCLFPPLWLGALAAAVQTAMLLYLVALAYITWRARRGAELHWVGADGEKVLRPLVPGKEVEAALDTVVVTE